MNYILKFLKIEIPNKNAKDCLIGASILMLGAGLPFSYGSINIYIYSYFQHYDKDFDIKNSQLLLSIQNVMVCILSVFSIKIAQIVGVVKLIRICSVLHIVSIYISAFLKSFYIFIVIHVIIGSGLFAFSLHPIIYCVLKHFPQNNVGKVGGLVFFSLSISCVLTIGGFTYLINPGKAKATILIKEENQNIQLFDQQVVERFQLSMVVINSIHAIFLIIGSFKIQEAKKVQSEQQKNQIPSIQKIEDQNQLNLVNNSRQLREETIIAFTHLTHTENSNINSNINNNSNNKQEILIDEPNYSPCNINKPIENQQPLKQILFSKTFILLYLITFLNGLYISFLTQNFKLYIQTKINDDEFITICIILNRVIGGFGNYLYGVIADRVNIKKILIVSQIVITSIVATFSSISSFKAFVIIWYVLIGIIHQGLKIATSSVLIGQFGFESAAKVFPIKTTSYFLSELVLQISNYFIISYFSFDNSLTLLGIISSSCIIFIIPLRIASYHMTIKPNIVLRQEQKL